jgi:hypothetical protein
MLHVATAQRGERRGPARAIHDGGSPVVLVTADVTASQRDQVYSCLPCSVPRRRRRLVYRLIEAPSLLVQLRGGAVVLRPPARSRVVCSTVGVLTKASAAGTTPTKKQLQSCLPEQVLLLEGIPMMTAAAFSPEIKNPGSLSFRA